MAKILIVEDRKEYRHLLKEKISPLYEVRSAMTAKEAIEELKTNPDVVILDMEFPEEQGGVVETDMGFEVLEKIKKTNPKIQVIILSSKEFDYEDAKRKGAFECLLKDTLGVFEKVLDIIEKCLKKS
ncbi:MAG: response regulator [bacterium]